jgi:hypothetical protein
LSGEGAGACGADALAAAGDDGMLSVEEAVHYTSSDALSSARSISCLR